MDGELTFRKVLSLMRASLYAMSAQAISPQLERKHHLLFGQKTKGLMVPLDVSLPWIGFAVPT
jgi:hypothetical protein